MPTVKVYNTEKKEVGEIQLNDSIFGVEVSVEAMHQVVLAQ